MAEGRGLMRCERCHGTGRAYTHPLSPLDAAGRGRETRPCFHCGGTGFAHCCDGERCQPEQSDEPQRAA